MIFFIQTFSWSSLPSNNYFYFISCIGSLYLFHMRPTSKYFFGLVVQPLTGPWECSPELCFLHVIWAFVIACTCIVVLEMYFYNFLGIRSGLCPYFSLLSKDAMCHVNLIFVNTEKLKKEKCTMRQLTKSIRKADHLCPLLRITKGLHNWNSGTSDILIVGASLHIIFMNHEI